MNAISNFTFHEKHNVRVQLINGEPWFCLPDVCLVLDIQNSRHVVATQLDKKGVVKNYTPSNGGNQKLNFVNEPNLYRVIFRSNKDEAKQFQDWVFNDVLPTIRKTGQYAVQQPTPPTVPREYITQEEMQKIKGLVALCTHHVGGKDSFTKAIHYSLRKATGVPSPNRFEVQHLPLIVAEFQRIFSIVEPYFHARAECQKLIIKHLIRDNAPQHLLQNLLDDLQSSVEVYNASKNEQVQSLFAPSYLALLRN